MYLLDTNVISAVRRPDRAPKVAAWLRDRSERDLYLSVVTLGAIERGIRQQERRAPAFADDLRQWLDRTLMLFSDRLLAFGAEEARIWGRLSHEIGRGRLDDRGDCPSARRDCGSSDFSATGVRIVSPF